VTYGPSQGFALRYPVPVSYAEVRFTGGAGRSVCEVYVERATNTVLLVNDSGSALLSGAAGSAGVLSTTQCAIDLASTVIETTSRELTLRVGVRFVVDWTGTPRVQTQTIDAQGRSSGWTAAAALPER
jgi:hypothetical protein